jgi:hypothetical protein
MQKNQPKYGFRLFRLAMHITPIAIFDLTRLSGLGVGGHAVASNLTLTSS